MTGKERFQLISAIIDRAERLGIANNRATHFIDLENAYKAFSLQLEPLLHASLEDFSHDFLGIWLNIDRNSGKFNEFFVPRYTGK